MRPADGSLVADGVVTATSPMSTGVLKGDPSSWKGSLIDPASAATSTPAGQRANSASCRDPAASAVPASERKEPSNGTPAQLPLPDAVPSSPHKAVSIEMTGPAPGMAD